MCIEKVCKEMRTRDMGGHKTVCLNVADPQEEHRDCWRPIMRHAVPQKSSEGVIAFLVYIWQMYEAVFVIMDNSGAHTCKTMKR